MNVRDGRKVPFVWASTDALAHIEFAWNGGRAGKEVRRRVGFNVYMALLRIANSEKARTKIGAEASDRFAATHAEIAWLADVTPRYVEQACEELERIELVVVEADRDGSQRPGRPSFYTLVEPPLTYEESSHPRGHRRTNPVQTPYEPISHVPREGTNSVRTVPYKGKKNSKKKEEGAGDQSPVVESTKATAAWTDAKQLLAARYRGERFDTYIRPLEVAGERDGRLVLVDSSEQGGGEWVGDVRPLILETLADFDDFEIIDETELDRAGLERAASAGTPDPLAAAPARIREAAPVVLRALVGICEVKRCSFPTEARVVAAMATYPDVDHRAVASDMEDRLLVGTWRGREVKDVAAMYRSFLKVEQQSATDRPPRGRQRGGEHPADARVREIRERRAAAGDVIDSDAVEER